RAQPPVAPGERRDFDVAEHLNLASEPPLPARAGEGLAEVSGVGAVWCTFFHPHLAQFAELYVAAVDVFEELSMRVDAELERERLQVLPRRDLDDPVLVDENDFGHWGPETITPEIDRSPGFSHGPAARCARSSPGCSRRRARRARPTRPSSAT